MKFEEIFRLVEQRKQELPEDSGTTRLMTIGLEAILPKLNEEIFEVALALETNPREDLPLEISQAFYYLICLSVFLDEPYSTFPYRHLEAPAPEDAHDLAKKLLRLSALICHQPCAATMKQLPPLLYSALNYGKIPEDEMLELL